MMKDMKARYTAGELAGLVGVSSRTVRFYDTKGLLKPVAYTEGGYRLYDNCSVLQLQKIRLLQYVGLSLEQIGHMMASQGEEAVTELLWHQKLLLEQKRKEINQVIASLEDALFACSAAEDERGRMESVLDILRVKDMESPFDYRYRFYETYSENQKDWFGWVYDQLQLSARDFVLDMGCGYGNLWIRNWTRIPEGVTVTAVDKLNSAIDSMERFYQEHKKFLNQGVKFIFLREDLEHISAKVLEHQYDCVVANHLWDFITDKDTLMEAAKRMLKRQGFMLSTYSSYGFMEEVSRLFSQLGAGVDFTELIARQACRQKLLEEQLHAHFAKVSRDVFQSRLTGIGDAGVLAGYIQNHYPKEYAAHASMWKEVLRKVNQYIARQGALAFVTSTPLYKCGL